ncbi:MAG: GntR family transcriptional regulator [Bacillota bacterium]|jgi:DNA-binding GntR family transcriptional regulator|nr:GntR family transcriptional regulator [Bacillota bacterium]NLV69299.1 GntR family transcriptional regulator [Clostridiales bacterium]
MITTRIPPVSATLSLPQNLFNQLRDDILQGKIAPGAKLTEHRICKEYNVSRTPVREAFQKLELDGLIQIIPNRGAFVIGLSRQDIEDMYELRKAYEAIAVRWAVERMTEQEFEELEEAYDIMEFYTQKGEAEKMLQINMHFHQLIYSATKNRMLQHVLTSYQIYTKNTKVSSEYIRAYLDEVLDEHWQIFLAFKAKDKDAATQAAIRHMENGKRRAGFDLD